MRLAVLREAGPSYRAHLELRLEALHWNDGQRRFAPLGLSDQSAEPFEPDAVLGGRAAHLHGRLTTAEQPVCPDCGGELKHLGEDVSEILEIDPIRFKVIARFRPKLACAVVIGSCGGRTGGRPIARGCFGPLYFCALLGGQIWPITCRVPSVRDLRSLNKCDWYRLATWRLGESERSAFEPLVESLLRHVMASTEATFDDTLKQSSISPGNGKPRPDRLWTYVREIGGRRPELLLRCVRLHTNRKGNTAQAHYRSVRAR